MYASDTQIIVLRRLRDKQWGKEGPEPHLDAASGATPNITSKSQVKKKKEYNETA